MGKTRQFRRRPLVPTADLDVELRASYYHGDFDVYYFKKVGLGQINNEDKYPVIETPQGLSEIEATEASLKVDYRLSGFKVTSVTGWSDNYNLLDGDLAISPEQDGQLGERFANRSINEDLKFTSTGDGPLQWVAGLYYLDKKQHAVNPVYLGPALVPGAILPRTLGIKLNYFFRFPNAPGTLLASRKDFDFSSKAYAAYGQADYDLTDRVQLTMGMRYDREDRGAVNRGTLAYDFALRQTVPVPADQDVQKYRSNTYDAVQPKVTLSFKPATDQLLYGTISKGFRSGGFNNTTRAAFATYPAETVWNYELGAKASAFDGRLRGDVAVFYEDDKNRPDFFFYVVDSTQNIFPIAHSIIKGVELSVSALPFSSLTINTSLTLMDTKILAIDTTAVDPVHSGLGKHLSYVYHTQFNLSALYEHTVSPDVTATVAADFSHKSRNWFWYSNTGFKQEPINLVNAQVGLQYKEVRVKLFADNLFDVSYVTAHDPNFAFGFDQDDAYPAPPRRYGVAVPYEF